MSIKRTADGNKWRRPWRRWLLGIALLLALGLGRFVIVFLWDRSQADAELRQAIAEADEADPGWRLDDLEASRRVVADNENGALVVMAASRLLPKDWRPKALDDLDKVPPPMQVTAQKLVELKTEVDAVAPALERARRMTAFSWGRYPIEYTPDFISTLVKEQAGARDIAWLLTLDAHLGIALRQPERTFHALHAAWNVNRSLGDEPLLIIGLMRVGLQSQVNGCLERALAQQEWTDKQLAAMANLLGDDAEQTLFLQGLRGERAGSHMLLTNVEEGTLSLSQTLNGMGRKNRAAPSYYDSFNDLLAGNMIRFSHAYLLRHMNKVVAIARQPGIEKYQAFQELEAETKETLSGDDKNLIMASLLVPAVLKVAQAERRARTQASCVRAGIAAERYRLRHGRWPESLQQLVAHWLLPEVPLDLYDSQPLRLRRTPDGLVIHSIGPQKNYAGDALDRLDQLNPPVIRHEFRLWDLDKRRQPAPPAPEQPADE